MGALIWSARQAFTLGSPAWQTVGGAGWEARKGRIGALIFVLGRHSR